MSGHSTNKQHGRDRETAFRSTDPELVDALNAFDGIDTLGSCAGQPQPFRGGQWRSSASAEHYCADSKRLLVPEDQVVGVLSRYELWVLPGMLP